MKKYTFGDKIIFLQVTFDDIVNFGPSKESTFKSSPLMNMVLIKLYNQKKPSGGECAKRLDIPHAKLSYTTQVLSDYNLLDICRIIKVGRLKRALLAHPYMPIDEQARIAGYASRWPMERVMADERFADFFADINLQQLRPNRYYR